MTPVLPVTHRLSLLGCGLAAAAALTLAGCGGDGSATAENTAAGQPPQRQPARSATEPPCPTKVTAFLRSLDRLRTQLAVGLSYGQYATEIRALRAGYDAIPVAHLTIGCLATTGTPSEKALNQYIDATNAWGECLADASCTTAEIEPLLQRKWRVASRFLSDAQ